MRARFAVLLNILLKPAVALGGAVIIAAGIIGGTYYELKSVRPTGSYVPVETGSITNAVSATGQVKAAQSTELSFQTPGQIASINVAVGDQVQAGQPLITLDDSALQAQLAGAEANLEVQQANLASLQSGTRPQQLSVDQLAVTQSADALRDAIQTAYVAADDAVQNKADQLFTNPRGSSPILNFVVPDQELTNNLQQERVALDVVLTTWANLLSSPNFATADPTQAAETTQTDLEQVSAFLADANEALAETVPSSSMPAATISAYTAAVSAGRSEVANSLSAVTGDQTALVSAQGALTLAEAGPTEDAVAAQQAQIDAAQAAIDSIKVELSQTVMTAPIAGTITEQNANPGEVVSPGVPLISLNGTGAFEADAQVSQSDLAQIAVGDTVEASFDAYASTTFPAVVTTIDPAATIDSNGVASYTVTVTFTTQDPRIKAGLTTYLQILTGQATTALVVPTTAIITNNGSSFVYVKTGSAPPVETPVTTGISSADGMTQITSGLSAGEEVLTFGTSSS